MAPEIFCDSTLIEHGAIYIDQEDDFARDFILLLPVLSQSSAWDCAIPRHRQ